MNFNIRMDDHRLDAYADAAGRCEISRHLWSVSNLNRAAGVLEFPVWPYAPDRDHPADPDTVGHDSGSLSFQVSDDYANEWLRAAYAAGLDRAPWVKIILDRAAGFGELNRQLDGIFQTAEESEAERWKLAGAESRRRYGRTRP